ncbi:MAG TPA: pyridoxal-phosphate dependent enzyme [Vicinamibacteria bacterium]|nr:pyridoxal-phosphate dependent enzyme [Vicinamibacteria bacterium]
MGEYPTPLQELPALSRRLGRPVFIKRDDQLGPAGGGNKTRKLEYLLAEARAQGATVVSTFGGLQSNHARLTAAAARVAGMEAHLFYFARRPEKLEGNLVLAELLGARMHFLGRGIRRRMSVERAARLARLIAWRRLGEHYFIPLGGHGVLAAIGYVRGALEIDEQARALGLGRGNVVVAAGTGGTLAGVVAGLALAQSPLRPLGIDVGALWTDFTASVGSLAEQACAVLGSSLVFPAPAVPLMEGTYVGRRYGTPTPDGLAALELVAGAEGVLLDPVYTSKAFAGLLDLCATGALPAGEPVIFLHTGGLPALFATLPAP